MTKEQTKALTVIELAALALGTAEHEKKLVELAAESKSIVEIKNGPGRDQCHGAAMKLRNTRTGIRATGKGARDDATKFSKAVIAEEDRLVSLIEPEEQRLLALRDVWDAAREAEKRAKAEAEAKRVALIREHIEDIRAIAVRAVGRRAEAIQIELADLIELGIDIPRFAELTGEAEQVRRATVDKLQGLYAAALAQEVEAARLAEERAALERERAEAEAKAKLEIAEAEARAKHAEELRQQREEEEADACMIAAMHEMYETLSEVSNWLYSSNANDALRKRVDAVLDKATYQPAKAAA